MVISPNDFSLWARLTGNKYPSTPRERAQKGPEVQRFIQNLDKEGMLGGKQEEQKKKEKGLPEKLATGALITGGIVAGVAAARDPRVQNVARRAGSATKDKIKDFLVNFSEPRDVDVDIVNASGDVTPNPREQQANVAPQLTAEEPVIAKRTPVSTGQIYGTESAISKETPYDDIGNVRQRAQIAQDKRLGGLSFERIPKSGQDYLTRQATKDRDYDIAYMVARGQGKTDEAATRIAYQARGMSESEQPLRIRKPTQHREFLSNLKTSSIRPESIDNLLKLVETGPQIILPEKAQNQVDGSSAIVLAGGGNNTNVIPTMGATIGGPSLTDQLATKMAVDNALDTIRTTNEPKTLVGPFQAAPIKGITIAGPSNIQRPGPDTVVERNKAGDITFVGDANYFSGQRELPIIYSTQRGTNEQLRRREFTPEQVRRLTEPKQELSPEPPSDPTSRDARMDRLEQSMAETRAISENLGRVGELLAQSSTGVPGSASISKLVPGTTRFDSARAAGLTSIPGITPRITSSNFQKNINLGKTVEAALPTTSRLFYEQDSEGRIIPETIETRKDRPTVIGEDTKTIVSGGGYQPRGGVGSSIGAYGLEPTDFAEAKISQTPTESPTSFTQAPGRARGPIDIVVSGGRANNNKFDTRTGGGYEGFKAEMDNIINQMRIPEGKTINIISGGASGVDAYAAQYATEKQQKGGNFTSEIMEADWSKGGTLPPAAPGQKPVADVNYDPKAGGARNQRMINKAEAAIIFDGGSGTKDFTERAQEEQKTRRFPVYNASDMKGSKNRFAGESLDVARQLQKIQTDQSVSPEQRRINAASFVENLKTDAILRSIDYS